MHGRPCSFIQDSLIISGKGKASGQKVTEGKVTEKKQRKGADLKKRVRKPKEKGEYNSQLYADKIIVFDHIIKTP